MSIILYRNKNVPEILARIINVFVRWHISMSIYINTIDELCRTVDEKLNRLKK